MGRLSSLRSPSLRSVSLREWAFLSLIALASACDQLNPAPEKPRVQAVLVEPGKANAGGTTASAPPAQITPVAEPVALRPVARAPLCEGQLGTKPQPFKPKRVPNQISADSGAELSADPLKAARGHWAWINFWAAWCVPCREELPLLFSWQKQLGAKVNFEFVSLDDDERQLREFLGHQVPTGLRQSYWLPDGAVRLAWLEALHLEAEPELPLQLLIDPEGQLRCRVQGAVDAHDLAVLERIVHN